MRDARFETRDERDVRDERDERGGFSEDESDEVPVAEDKVLSLWGISIEEVGGFFNECDLVSDLCVESPVFLELLFVLSLTEG